MRKIVGIRLEEHGKVYHFDSGHFVLKKNDKVIVNTEQGQAFGVVCIEPKVPDDDSPERPLKKVQRIATKKDTERYEKKCDSEKEIIVFCDEKIKEKSLAMCIVSASRLFDGSKIIVYFTADGRVDFRELVKDLVQKFRTRVEMRQIGVRHQAKMVGGLGTCGRQLCCTSFLNTFEPVSIRMAKKQNISLNPSKISGMCGRLMCCLTFEHEYYEQLRKDLPKIGKTIKTEKGEGKVVRQNLLRETVTVVFEDNEEIEIPFRDIHG
ncbi:MAG: stage 0 sporulation family protein [Deltaproteobacteria bacterium]|nr:stage 0 sporulation family protein [Deltaproteobacteria bacterium]